MKKRILSMFIAVLMVVLMIPFSALSVFAAEEVTEVSTFAELVAAVNADKTNIKLTANIAHKVPMELPEQHRLVFDGNKEYVLDLNGCDLNVQNLTNEYFAGTISFIKVMGTSKVTIKNGYIGFGNNKSTTRENYGCIQVTDSAELITDNVTVESFRTGCTVILEKQAKATLNGGMVQAMNGYAVYAIGTSALTLDYGVTLRTVVGGGVNTVSMFGYGSLYFLSSGDLTVYNAYLKSGVQVHKTQIDEFDFTKKEVKINGTELTKKIYDGDEIPKPSEYDYRWYQGDPTAYAIITTGSSSQFVLEVSVIDTERKFPITVTNGVAKVGGTVVTEAKFGETITLEANAPESGYEFTYWSGDYSFADNSSATTTFVMPYGSVVTSSNYGKEKIQNIDVILPTPQVGEPLYDTITSVSDKSEFVSIRWFLVNGGSTTPLTGRELFAAGNTYKVVVEFSPANGWLFDSNPSATVNGNTASASSSMPSVATVQYTFTALSSSFPVYYTDTKLVGFGSTMTVDVEKMADENTDFMQAYFDDKVTYQWYKNGEAINGATEESYKITSANNGDNFQVKVMADGAVSCGSVRTFNEKLIGEIVLTMDDPIASRNSSDFVFYFLSAGLKIADENGFLWQELDGGWTNIEEPFVFEANKQYRLVLDIIAPEGYSFVSPIVYADGRKTSATDYTTLTRVWITFNALPVHTHAPTADDGDCTTPITCVCGEVMTAGAATHTAGADDGDCTTAVKCTVCDKNAIEAKATHTAGADDGDCTTAVKCTVCDKNAIEAKAAHADADTNGKCDTCSKDMPTTPGGDEPGTDTPGTETPGGDEPGTEPGTTPGTDDPNTPDDPTDDEGGLGAGTIVAIVIGSVVVVGVGGFALFWFVIKKKTWAEFLAIFKKG